VSDTAANLRHKIDSAGDLQGVVRTMKALAASSISQYENSVHALGDYYRTVELGLSACFRAGEPSMSAGHPAAKRTSEADSDIIGAIVFGSDQGLVGQFNEEVADFAIKTLASLPGKLQVWAVGERVRERLADAGLPIAKSFAVPTNVNAIAPLVGQIQIETETHRANRESSSMYVFHNQPKSGALYEPISQRLLPLDLQWQQGLARIPWPTGNLPEILGTGSVALRALIREYLFISLYRACAESLASENASRLAAMQRAEKNIDELLEDLASKFHQLRQSSIDEELFDVVAGYELLGKEQGH
jgi:F-type H+-transporting ATPase subunit gamma